MCSYKTNLQSQSGSGIWILGSMQIQKSDSAPDISKSNQIRIRIHRDFTPDRTRSHRLDHTISSVQLDASQPHKKVLVTWIDALRYQASTWFSCKLMHGRRRSHLISLLSQYSRIHRNIYINILRLQNLSHIDYKGDKKKQANNLLKTNTFWWLFKKIFFKLVPNYSLIINKDTI